LGRDAIAGQRVQTAAHEGVAIARALRLRRRDLEEVAALVERGGADEVLDLDRVRRARRLVVADHDLHQERLAGEHARRRPALDVGRSPDGYVGMAARWRISVISRSLSARWRPSESCAWASTRRCARHGTASSLTSSGITKSRPAASAAACAARYQPSAPRVD